MPKNTTKKKNSRYRPKMAVDVYAMARAGMTERAMAEILGISTQTFHKWKSVFKSFSYGLQKGRDDAADSTAEDYRTFIVGRLPTDLKDLWDELMDSDDEENPVERIEKLLRMHGRKAHQRLVLHALVYFNFDIGKACRFCHVPRRTFQTWKLTDPDFLRLSEEITEVRKDFYEHALVRLVKEGNPAAVIHANKTFNADRGYSTKIDVTHSGQIDHRVSVISVSDLDLSADMRLQILEAIRRLRESQAQRNAITATFEQGAQSG